MSWLKDIGATSMTTKGQLHLLQQVVSSEHDYGLHLMKISNEGSVASKPLYRHLIDNDLNEFRTNR
jgi:hypothetical protein